jgi:hypothetical protein
MCTFPNPSGCVSCPQAFYSIARDIKKRLSESQEQARGGGGGAGGTIKVEKGGKGGKKGGCC